MIGGRFFLFMILIFIVNRVFLQNDSAEQIINYREILLNPTYTDIFKNTSAQKILSKMTIFLKENCHGSVEKLQQEFPIVYFLEDPDKKWRFATFTMLYQDGTYKNFGLIQKFNKKGCEIFSLEDNSENVKNPLHKSFGPSNWIGAIYYGVRKTSKKSWLLLGLDMHNQESRFKIAEPFSFNAKGFPNFGAPIIKHEGKTYYRLMLQYKAVAQVRLNWDESLKMIVYDNLTPINTSAKFTPSFYVPDGSYNGLKLKGKVWHIILDVDARNPKEKNTSSYKIPEKGLFPPEEK